jgi:hypothetical protein
MTHWKLGTINSHAPARAIERYGSTETAQSMADSPRRLEELQNAILIFSIVVWMPTDVKNHFAATSLGCQFLTRTTKRTDWTTWIQQDRSVSFCLGSQVLDDLTRHLQNQKNQCT